MLQYSHIMRFLVKIIVYKILLIFFLHLCYSCIMRFLLGNKKRINGELSVYLKQIFCNVQYTSIILKPDNQALTSFNIQTINHITDAPSQFCPILYQKSIQRLDLTIPGIRYVTIHYRQQYTALDLWYGSSMLECPISYLIYCPIFYYLFLKSAVIFQKNHICHSCKVECNYSVGHKIKCILSEVI